MTNDAPTFKIDSNRSYSLGEIEQLRAVCEYKYCFGTYGRHASGFASSRVYHETDKNKAVESMVHSNMHMGITAADLIEHEKQAIAARLAEYAALNNITPRDETAV